MPIPEGDKIDHHTFEPGEVPVLNGGDVLVETTNHWFAFTGDVRHRFVPGDKVLVKRKTAEGLVTGNAVKIVEEPKRKPGRPRKHKMVEPEENK